MARIRAEQGPDKSLKEVEKIYADHFFEVYERRIDFIKTLAEERNFEKVLLCCCHADSLGRYYAKVNKLSTENQQRFINFLLLAEPKYPELQKVWLLGLKLKLDKTGKRELAHYLSTNWGLDPVNFSREGYNPDVTFSQLSETVQANLASDEMNRLLQYAPEFKYTKIIWRQYRNFSVHEGRLGHSWEVHKGNRPITSIADQLDLENNRWFHYVRFGVPWEFLHGCIVESFLVFRSEILSSSEKLHHLYRGLKETDSKDEYLFITPKKE